MSSNSLECACPKCQTRLRFSVSGAQAQVTCPKCSHAFIVRNPKPQPVAKANVVTAKPVSPSAVHQQRRPGQSAKSQSAKGQSPIIRAAKGQSPIGRAASGKAASTRRQPSAGPARSAPNNATHTNTAAPANDLWATGGNRTYGGNQMGIQGGPTRPPTSSENDVTIHVAGLKSLTSKVVSDEAPKWVRSYGFSASHSNNKMTIVVRDFDKPLTELEAAFPRLEFMNIDTESRTTEARER